MKDILFRLFFISCIFDNQKLGNIRNKSPSFTFTVDMSCIRTNDLREVTHPETVVPKTVFCHNRVQNATIITMNLRKKLHTQLTARSYKPYLVIDIGLHQHNITLARDDTLVERLVLKFREVDNISIHPQQTTLTRRLRTHDEGVNFTTQ